MDVISMSTSLSVQYLAFNSFNPLYFCPFPTIFPEAQFEYLLNMNDWLFPDSDSMKYENAWTTSAHVDLSFVSHVDLADDDALGVHAVDKRTAHPVVSAPTGLSSDIEGMETRKTNLAWEAFYPAGSINPSGPIQGGLGFYMHGPKAFEERLRDAKEVLLGYSVMFERDWEWVLGGKLPGVYGGASNSAYHCTGGRDHDRETCFNLRLMWRTNGTGELYAYLPNTSINTSILLSVPPKSIRNPDYGFSVGRGSFNFTAGKWNTITERVKVNDVGKENGEVEVRLNGVIAISVKGLVIRTRADAYVQGLHVQSFFGGSKPEWASPKDQHAWSADFSGAIIS